MAVSRRIVERVVFERFLHLTVTCVGNSQHLALYTRNTEPFGDNSDRSHDDLGHHCLLLRRRARLFGKSGRNAAAHTRKDSAYDTFFTGFLSFLAKLAKEAFDQRAWAHDASFHFRLKKNCYK
jgi:hypothetical protein